MSEKKIPPGFMFIVSDFGAGAQGAEENQRLDRYRKEAARAVEAVGTSVEVIAFAPPGGIEVLQGEWPFEGGFALERYPSLSAVKALFHSELYHDAKKHRAGLMDFEAAIAVPGLPDGLGPDIRVADPALDVRDGVKSAYLIVAGEVKDPDGMGEYMKTGPALAKAAGQEFSAFARSKDLDVLEGRWPWPDADLLIERFPSLEAARKFFHDPAYQSALASRAAAYRVRFVILAKVLAPQGA